MRFSAARRVMSGSPTQRRKRRANKLVSEKIPVLKAEGLGQRQAVAEAISMERAGRLRPGGVYVPAKKKS